MAKTSNFITVFQTLLKNLFSLYTSKDGVAALTYSPSPPSSNKLITLVPESKLILLSDGESKVAIPFLNTKEDNNWNLNVSWGRSRGSLESVIGDVMECITYACKHHKKTREDMLSIGLLPLVLKYLRFPELLRPSVGLNLDLEKLNKMKDKPSKLLMISEEEEIWEEERFKCLENAHTENYIITVQENSYRLENPFNEGNADCLFPFDFTIESGIWALEISVVDIDGSSASIGVISEGSLNKSWDKVIGSVPGSWGYAFSHTFCFVSYCGNEQSLDPIWNANKGDIMRMELSVVPGGVNILHFFKNYTPLDHTIVFTSLFTSVTYLERSFHNATTNEKIPPLKLHIAFSLDHLCHLKIVSLKKLNKPTVISL